MNSTNNLPLRRAALIAGLALLIMVFAAPFSELYVYPKLVVPDDPSQTVRNLILNKSLFISLIFGYLITFICDVLAAWALYVLLRPVNKDLSLLTALFRLVYTVIALAALLNLVTVFRLLDPPDYFKIFQPEQLNVQIMFSLRIFRSQWYLGLIFFGIHLGLLGYLVIRSKYIPWILGALLIITGLGYLLTNLKPYLFPGINTDLAKYTFYGELIFMLWLLIRGSKIKESA